jgi:hypothetical protein
MTPDYNTSDSLRWNNVVKSIVMGTLRAANYRGKSLPTERDASSWHLERDASS